MNTIDTTKEVGGFFDIPSIKYEYLDHPADVQLHAWGVDIKECFEQTAMAMFGYMTTIEHVDIQTTWPIECHGRDLESLLYNYMNEFLYFFSAEDLIARKVIITKFLCDGKTLNYSDLILLKDKISKETEQLFEIEAKGFGEKFDLCKHSQGTEVKAITYSCLQIHMNPDKCDSYVIIDI